jgi:hypothetical protein
VEDVPTARDSADDFEGRYLNALFGMEPWFRHRFRRQAVRVVAKVVVHAVLFALIGAGISSLVDKAVGTGPTGRDDLGGVIAPRPACGTLDDPCRWQIDRANRIRDDFHDAKLGRAHGFTGSRLFRHPRHARRVIVTRINHWLDNHPKFANSSANAGRDGSDFYGMAQDNANCVANAPYPASSSNQQGSCSKTTTYNTHGLTTAQVRAGLKVTGCGAAVSFAVATSELPPVAVMTMAAIGAFNCSALLW